jgi:hypothetical protein
MGQPLALETAYRPIVEDIKTFYTQRVSELERQFGRVRIQDAIRFGHLDTRYSPTFGEIAFLSARARRACGLRSAYVPSESAVGDHLATRAALAMLEGEGYRFKDMPQKELWQLTGPNGGDVLMITSLRGRLARSVDATLRGLAERDGPLGDLAVIVVHPNPTRLKGLVARYGGRVSVRPAPWVVNAPWTGSNQPKRKAPADRVVEGASSSV